MTNQSQNKSGGMGPALRKVALLCAKLAVSGSLLYYVLEKSGTGRVMDALRQIRPEAFAAAVGMFVFLVFLATLRWRWLLPEHFALSRLFPLYMLGSFFNIFMPGVVGGDAFKIYYLYKESGKGAQAMASVFMDRYLGYLALMTMGLLAYPLGRGYFKGTWIEWLLPGAIVLFALASAVIFGLRLGRRFKFMADVYGFFASYKSNKAPLYKAIAISFVIHVINVMCVYVLALGIGVSMPLLPLFIFIPIVATVAAVPLSISGIGLREASMVILFGTLGIEAQSATAISFLWFLSIAAGGLPGLFFYIKWKAPAEIQKD